MHDTPAGVIKEIAIMRMLSGNPHVVQLFNVFEDDSYFHLVMELCAGGELFDQIISKGHFSERDAAVSMRALLDFISYAHSKHIVHRYVACSTAVTSSTQMACPVSCRSASGRCCPYVWQSN
eukprot:GHRR01031460.1.p2 GENE.GHRR01031460.1~~GHRR01031460.1.p2  ORF type:complete len:122 (+),score=41.22 GHRR01031460.1:1343-1708(+)